MSASSPMSANALQPLMAAVTEFNEVADFDRQVVDPAVAFALAQAAGDYLSSIGR
ncbi:hypothetical protein MAHJHV63_52960 [Mycobacterium avium subsp. hominissuis]